MYLTIRPVAGLSAREWDQIWSFTTTHVELERTRFEAMLRTRSHVALVYADARRTTVVGTTSITEQLLTCDGQTVVMLYTGDVLLHPELRGRNVLQRIGLVTYLRARLRHPFRPIYWFIAAASVTAYLLLARNLRRYWPNPSESWPPDMVRLRDTFAEAVLPEYWDATHGIFRVAGIKRFRVPPAAPSSGRAVDAHVQYFVEQNPGYRTGEALACLARLDATNWGTIIGRMLRRSLSRTVRG